MSSLSMFEFTEEDLKSNKRGFFSASQKAMLKGYAEGMRRTQRGGLWVVIFFLFLGLCIILGVALSNERSRAALLSSPFNLIALAMTVPVVLGIFALSIWAAYRRADRLTNAELKSVEGVARLDESHDDGGRLDLLRDYRESETPHPGRVQWQYFPGWEKISHFLLRSIHAEIYPVV